MPFQTEFIFTLPRGYIDNHGNLHREGVMRLFMASDEIMLIYDHRFHSSRDVGLIPVMLISQTCLRIGDVYDIDEIFVENLFTADFEYLKVFYRAINETGASMISVQCPKCDCAFDIDIGRRSCAQRGAKLGQSQ